MAVFLAQLPESPFGPHLRQDIIKISPKLHLLLIVSFVHAQFAILDSASVTVKELLFILNFTGASRASNI
jgi:hypothetical protein